MNHLLELDDVHIDIMGPGRTWCSAVRGINLVLDPGQAMGLVGESGSGKSLTALSILRLLPSGARLAGGSIRLRGKDISRMGPKELRALRGGAISLVQQNALMALNPAFTIGHQIAEAIRAHQRVSKTVAKDQAIGLLDRVGVTPSSQRFDNYPHQLSGGMLQRVMIAMAISNGPDVLIADEPTTALDVIVQRQILDLVSDLQEQLGMGIIWVSHDLAVVKQLCERLMVFYAGDVVEAGLTKSILDRPGHPYTEALIASTPDVALRRGVIESIPGRMPSPSELISGCRFHPRCGVTIAGECDVVLPQMVPTSAGAAARCVLIDRSPIEREKRA